MKEAKGENLKLYSDAGFREKISLLIASCLFAGHLPLAPGTWGSLIAAFVVYFFVPTKGFLFLLFCLTVFAAGVITSNIMERYDGIKDNSKIVIDEALGFFLAVAYLPKMLWVFFAAFIFFRIFDIWKPWPIRYVDKNIKGGIGVMLDDVIAGIFANILIRIFLIF